MSEDDDRTGPDPMAAGLEQFQRAALEAIRAGRAMLDAAETMLQDPKAAEHLVRSVSDVARAATETVAGFATRVRPPGPGAADGDAEDGDDPSGGFERIRVD